MTLKQNLKKYFFQESIGSHFYNVVRTSVVEHLEVDFKNLVEILNHSFRNLREKISQFLGFVRRAFSKIERNLKND